VEVTLSSGARQYESEGEPVARHLGDHQKGSVNDSYCLFITSSLHDATTAHFYIFHRTPVLFYGDTSKIIPIELDDFRLTLSRARETSLRPTANDIHRFVSNASALALKAANQRSIKAHPDREAQRVGG
jgi:hypothetical protein